MSHSLQSSLPPALQALLESQAADAVLLASIGEQVLKFSANQPVQQVSELSPPDEWFEAGELEWLTHDGALLGLIWSPNGLQAATLQLLTLLLSTARGDEGARATNVLMTQFPESAAWLDEHLVFQQVSRRFLELYSLSTEQVIGQRFETVFGARQPVQELLEQALTGKSVSLAREALPWHSKNGETQLLWLRSQMRPYFGGVGAGVLWTVQDISGEISLAARVSALLGSARFPTAILDHKGQLLESSDSFADALLQRNLNVPARGQLLSQWPIWDSSAVNKNALSQALKQVAEASNNSVSKPLKLLSPASDQEGNKQSSKALSNRVELQLYQSDVSSLPEALEPLLVAEFQFAEHGETIQSQLLVNLIQQSPQAVILLGQSDESGARPLWMLSNVAQQLLGLERYVIKAGQPFDELLSSQQITFSRADTTPLSTQQLLNPSKAGAQQVILNRADGSRRYLEATSIALNLGANKQQSPLSLYLEDVTSKRHLEERLQHDARHDPLTGLPNWAGLRERLKNKSAASHCLMVVSIDDYSALQAALGRSPCDHLLIQVAAKLHQWRKDAIIARLEGESFVAALPPHSAESAIKLARELQELLSRPMRAGGREVQVSTSIGISCDALPPEDLLDQSRTALHAAQRSGSGRGGIEYYRLQLRQHEAELVGLESELRRALPAQDAAGHWNAGQFAVLLQPIVNLLSGRVQGAELLLRWNHPDKGLISPRVFLPLVSRAGLMSALGQWVLTQAQSFRQRWAQQYPFLKLHLNLSSEELESGEYMQHFQAALKEVGGLNIEISAASLLGNTDHSQLLHDLRMQGSELFVDDFGDGASSITSLERFALSGMKLHPAFVGNLQEGARPLALLEGTVSLARRLNLQVIAVGIETQAQALLLSNAGCEAAQGYFYSPPRALEDFEHWLTSQVMD